MTKIVEIYTCECGKNIIILDENYEDTTDIEDIQCPICGEQMVSHMTRKIDIEKLS